MAHGRQEFRFRLTGFFGTRVMLSESTRDLAGPEIFVRELDLIRVKGKSEPTRVFELLTGQPAADEFSNGLAAYRRQDWDQAEPAFKSCLAGSTTDPVPRVFIERIAHLRANPPGPNWDGVWEFQTK